MDNRAPSRLRPRSHQSFVLLTAILLLVLTADGRAGEWSVEVVGPGTVAETTRVLVQVSADLEGQCPGHTCGFMIGTHRTRISPAPPTQDIPCSDSVTIDESGMLIRMNCVAGDGSVSWEMDIYPGTSYLLSDGESRATWMTYEQGGSCDGVTPCDKVDDAFGTMPLNVGSVALEPSSWTVLKVRFGS